MPHDFNDGEPQKDFSEPMPKGTCVWAAMGVRPGGAGDDGALTQSNSSEVKYLSVEFTVKLGEHKGRKWFENWTVEGGQLDEKGISKGWRITKSRVRAVLNSAHAILPDDDSPAAIQKRRIEKWAELHGLEFACRLGIDEGDVRYDVGGNPNGKYPDKNRISIVIEPDHKDYEKVRQGQSVTTGAVPASSGGGAPSWATQQQPQPAADQSRAAAAKPTEKSNLPAWAR